MPTHGTILIADAVDAAARELLTADGFGVVYRPEITHAELVAAVPDAEALIVRSRSRISADVLAAGGRLRVVGRAGAGVDNIDVAEATRRGVVVMNTPGGNTVSTAEHTIAMMLALARNIPAADRSVRAMEWKRSSFTGVEVSGKTLGLVGLGRVGAEVALRAAGLGMRVMAYDPLVTEEAARKLGAEPAALPELLRCADFISVHTPLTPETKDLLGLAAFRACKRGVRIVNCARGGIVNERDLLTALDEGTVAGAALDVFETEPPDNPALVGHPAVVCTPHLGASTGEAQEKVAIQVARQIADFLLGRNVAGTVNAGVIAAAMRGELRPLLTLAEKLGGLMVQLRPGPVAAIRLGISGDLPGDAPEALLAALAKGFLAPVLSESVNYLNASLLARERGIVLSHAAETDRGRYPVELSAEFTTAAGRRVVGGTVHGASDVRIIDIDGFHVETKPEGHVLIYRNIDRPGMLAGVSALLAARGVNIADLSLGRSRPGGNALTVVSLDTPVPDEILREIAKIDGIFDLHAVEL